MFFELTPRFIEGTKKAERFIAVLTAYKESMLISKSSYSFGRQQLIGGIELLCSKTVETAMDVLIGLNHTPMNRGC